MIDYTKFTKEDLLKCILASTDPNTLIEMQGQLAAYGWSPSGVLMNKLRRRLQSILSLPQEKEILPDPDLPVITADIYIGPKTEVKHGTTNFDSGT
jgi:hypothetical protein